MKQKATVYRARFRTLVQSHLDILENSDWESLEELESGLEEQGNQLEQYAEQDQSREMLMDQNTHEYKDFNTQEDQDFNTQEYQDFNTQEFQDFNNMNNVEDNAVMDEVAASSYYEEEEPRRELRRTSRKLKKKAMF